MPKQVRSLICLSDEIANTDPLFGANDEYLSAWMRLPDGSECPIMFTAHDLMQARHRASRNPEDVGPKPGYFRRLWWALLP